jgi:hypothetical protein
VDRDALGMASVIGSAIVEFLRPWVYAHLGIPYPAPSTASAAQIMMDDYPVPDLEVLYPWTQFDYPAAGLMSHSPELCRVSLLIPRCPESPKVAPAESGSTHFNNDFRENRFGFGKIPYFQMSLAEKYDSFHHPLLSPIPKIRQIASE